MRIVSLFRQKARVLGVLMMVFALAACSSSPEAKRAKFFEQGKKNAELKNYNAAILDFKNALVATPSNELGAADAETLYQLGLAYLAAGDGRSGVSSLLQAAELDPKHALARVKLAELMATSQDPSILQEAAKNAETAISLAPESVEALRALATAELRLGQPEDAERHLMAALVKSPQDMVSAFSLARLKLSTGEVAEAEKIMLQAAGQAPPSVSVAEVLGQFYMMLRKPAEAEVQFQRAVEMEPKNGAALFFLATLQHRTGQLTQAEQTFKRLSALPGNTYRAMHAMFLFDKGDHAAAIKEMEELVKQNPNDRVTQARLLQSYEATGRLKDAERVLVEALKRNPKDLASLEGRSRLFIARRQYSDAQKDLLQIVSLAPDSGPAHYLLAKVYHAQGEARYRQELDEAVELDPTLLDARIGLAESLRQQRTPQAALDLIDAAPVFQKNTVPAIVERNWALMDLAQESEMRKGIDAGLKLARTPALLLQDALLKLRQKSFDAARVSLQEALKSDPENIRVLETMADSYLAQNAGNRSIEFVRQHAATHPKSAFLQQFLATRLLRAGDRKGARTALQAALTAGADPRSASVELARLDILEGNWDTARQGLTKVLSTDPSNGLARLLMGEVEGQKKNFSAAADQYRKVLETQPQNLLAMNNLSYLLVEHLGRADEGLQLAQKVVEQAPDFIAAQDTLGWAFYRKGLHQTALQYLEKASSKDSKNSQVRYHLAMVHRESGNLTKAKSEFAVAVRLDPSLNTPEARELFGTGTVSQ